MPPPARTELRAGQKLVDEFFECGLTIRAGCILECLDFLRRGRQAGEVEMGTANERARVGIGHWLQSCGFQLRQNKIIQKIARPFLVVHFR